MMFHHALRPCRLGFKTLLSPFPATSSTRFLGVGVHAQIQTRLASLGPTLPEPWQVCNLSPREQELYKTHGPDYVDHVPKSEGKKYLRGLHQRERAAIRYREKLGEDWYDVITESKRRFDEREGHIVAEFKERKEKLAAVEDAVEKMEGYILLKKEKAAWQESRKAKQDQIDLEVLEERRKSS